MNLAVKLFIDVTVGDKPTGIPDAWPAEVIELGDSTTLPVGPYQLMTSAQYESYLVAHQSEYDTWRASVSTVKTINSIEKRFYKSIAASSSDFFDYVIPNGALLELKELGGSGIDPNAIVQIIFDPAVVNQILLSTIYDSTQSSTLAFTGDGVKALRIFLDNQDSNSHFMGGYFIGDQFGG